MVQLEVGERLAARPGSRGLRHPVGEAAAGGRPPPVVGKVPARVFVPPPRVESALVEIVRHPAPAGAEDERRAAFELVETGFGQRRKMLRRSLAERGDPEAFDAAGVRPEARAEELTLADWRRLAAADVVADLPVRPC